MSGGAGNDIYYVENVGDAVAESTGEGADTVYTSVSYALAANSEIETLAARDPNATVALNLTGNGFVNTLEGNNGANILNGGGGADAMRGLAGNDIYFVDDGGDQIVEGAGGGVDIAYANVNYALGAGAQVETLSAINNSLTDALNLTGNGFSNNIYGNNGANVLNGGGGADIMLGFGGDDTYFIDNAGDLIAAEGPAGGTDAAYTTTSYTLSADAQVETLSAINNSLTTALSLTGNGFANNIYGNNGANTLNGGGGADIMLGFGGNDIYFIDNGGDLIAAESAGGGNDTAYTSISYALGADAQIETLSAINNSLTTALSLTGNDFANSLYGNNGANTLNGGGGADIMLGFGGDDIYFVDNANDLIAGEGAGGGNDTAYASTSYALSADAQVETLSAVDNGATTALSLTGNGFANNIWGNNGANTLNGGGGADILLGFGGSDTFAFTTALGGGNVDFIVDFASGDFASGMDRIALDDAVFVGLELGALDAGAFVVGTAAGDADDRIIYNSATGALYYDLDGNGAGSMVQFATLNPATTLASADFLVI
jgi:serralysin